MDPDPNFLQLLDSDSYGSTTLMLNINCRVYSHTYTDKNTDTDQNPTPFTPP
jgi:hypothetical protein